MLLAFPQPLCRSRKLHKYRRPREAPGLAISNLSGWMPDVAWCPQEASLTGVRSSSPSCTWGRWDQAFCSGISCSTSLTHLGVSACLHPLGILFPTSNEGSLLPLVVPSHPILLPYFGLRARSLPPGGKSAKEGGEGEASNPGTKRKIHQ